MFERIPAVILPRGLAVFCTTWAAPSQHDSELGSKQSFAVEVLNACMLHRSTGKQWLLIDRVE